MAEWLVRWTEKLATRVRFSVAARAGPRGVVLMGALEDAGLKRAAQAVSGGRV